MTLNSVKHIEVFRDCRAKWCSGGIRSISEAQIEPNKEQEYRYRQLYYFAMYLLAIGPIISHRNACKKTCIQ